METQLWEFENRARNSGYTRIAGIDEAGRGPLAGPVVAAAVIPSPQFDDSGIDDSKKLRPSLRERLYERIYDQALAVGIGIIDAVWIDRVNILQASLLAMAMAVDNLIPAPDFLLIDGTFPITSPVTQQAIPKGDSCSASIAAASIVAKVTRDRMMVQYDGQFPQFGFCRHKGYPTQAHRTAIRIHGCCPIHRRSFRGVKEFVASRRTRGRRT